MGIHIILFFYILLFVLPFRFVWIDFNFNFFILFIFFFCILCVCHSDQLFPFCFVTTKVIFILLSLIFRPIRFIALRHNKQKFISDEVFCLKKKLKHIEKRDAFLVFIFNLFTFKHKKWRERERERRTYFIFIAQSPFSRIKMLLFIYIVSFEFTIFKGSNWINTKYKKKKKIMYNSQILIYAKWNAIYF